MPGFTPAKIGRPVEAARAPSRSPPRPPPAGRPARRLRSCPISTYARSVCERGLVDQRPDVGASASGRRRGAAAPRASHQRPQEVVVDLPVQDQPAGGGAALAGGAERAPEHALERQVEVGVVHHDHRVLAAHLERQPLVHPAADLADAGAGLRRAGERDDRHVRVLDERRSRRSRRGRAPAGSPRAAARPRAGSRRAGAPCAARPRPA